MIEYHYETDFALSNETMFSDWIDRVLREEKVALGDINYIFCSDDYLLELNRRYLDHDTLTDIITFEYTKESEVSGDVFISIDRVRDNAGDFEVPFDEELKRVMVHGVLHLLGYGDKSEEEKAVMRNLEEQKMKLFHVEH